MTACTNCPDPERCITATQCLYPQPLASNNAAFLAALMDKLERLTHAVEILAALETDRANKVRRKRERV